MHFFFKEATTGFEPVIKVLQTYALPLGYVATSHPAPLLLGSRASSQSSPRSADAPFRYEAGFVSEKTFFNRSVEDRGLEPGTDRL